MLLKRTHLTIVDNVIADHTVPRGSRPQDSTAHSETVWRETAPRVTLRPTITSTKTKPLLVWCVLCVTRNFLDHSRKPGKYEFCDRFKMKPQKEDLLLPTQKGHRSYYFVYYYYYLLLLLLLRSVCSIVYKAVGLQTRPCPTRLLLHSAWGCVFRMENDI